MGGKTNPELDALLAERHPLPTEVIANQPQVLEAEPRVSREIVIESIRTENDARDAFERLYQAEVIRLQRCPIRVRRDGGWEPCGIEIPDIQAGIVHWSMHLILEAKDERVKRAALNDVRDKLWPDEIKGVKAALSAEERTALFANPVMRQKLLSRGKAPPADQGVVTDE